MSLDTGIGQNVISLLVVRLALHKEDPMHVDRDRYTREGALQISWLHIYTVC